MSRLISARIQPGDDRSRQREARIGTAQVEHIANADTGTATQASAGIRRHTVCSGESAWSIARRYGIPVKTLLARNNLDAKAVLKPGMVLRFDEPR